MSNAIQAIPPLETVQDPAAQSALRALASGWNLRNGLNEEYRWLTKSDVVAIVKKLLPEPESATQVTRDFSRSGSGPAASYPNLLIRQNTWTATNTFDQPAPATEQAPNCHIMLAQGGFGKWAFRLGHGPIPQYTGGPLGTDSRGDLVITQPGGGGAETDFFMRFQSFANGGGISFLGRKLANSRGKTAIQLRDNMHIGWNADASGRYPGGVDTYFDPANGRWTLSNAGYNRFGVSVNTGDPFPIYINDAPLKASAIHFTRSDFVESNLNTVVLDHGASINDLRQLEGDWPIVTTIQSILARLTAAGH